METRQIDFDVKSTVFYKYHQRTKHSVQSLRSSTYRLDWASQPNPFLHFDGAPLVELPKEFEVSKLDYFETMERMVSDWRGGMQSVGATADVAKFLSNLLLEGMALSAWKQVVGTDHRWALRVNASSGNLHPTDTEILIRDDSEGLGAGLYHYRVDEHGLDKRSSGDLVTPLVKRLELDCEPPPIVLCLTSIFFREAWKYRDRAFRYCQHDLGHALAALSLSCSSLGWTSRIVCNFPDEEMLRYLGLTESGQKPLAFMLIAPVGHFKDHEKPVSFLKPAVTAAELEAVSHDFAGTPNKLTSNFIDYDSINSVYTATTYDSEQFARFRTGLFATGGGRTELPGAIVACADPVDVGTGLRRMDCLQDNVHQTIRQRRSAVDMDGKTGMDAEHCKTILRLATLGFAADFQGVDVVRGGEWRRAASEHFVQVYIYVHRVDGLKSGLYFFDRFEGKLVPLLQNDQREVAMSTSCFQDIASDGAFSISMIADFETAYKCYGERAYRLVHYEAGFIGQMLYLAASALGHDATGIGCFIDDAINNYLGLSAGKEVIYNFTIGKAVVDDRLTTLPAYSFPTPY